MADPAPPPGPASGAPPRSLDDARSITELLESARDHLRRRSAPAGGARPLGTARDGDEADDVGGLARALRAAVLRLGGGA